MASIVIYNTGNTRVLNYLPTANTPDYEGRPDVLINANVDALMASNIPIKYWKVVAGNVVEMTTSEKASIDGFETAQRITEQKAMAKALHDQVDSIGRLVRAVAKINIDENNIAYKWLRDFKAAVANATSLADLKLGVGALPNTPDRTYAQGKTAIENLIEGE